MKGHLLQMISLIQNDAGGNAGRRQGWDVPEADDSDHFMIYLPDSTYSQWLMTMIKLKLGVTCLVVIRQKSQSATGPE